jgi:hypothetical protein
LLFIQCTWNELIVLSLQRVGLYGASCTP